MNKRLIAIGLASLFGLSGTLALAKVSPEQAARLGGEELTPMGAERAGSADGTIPRWEGGYQERPAGYVEGERLVDPFSDDAVLFTITAANVDQYADKLSPGQVAMFRRYPDTYQMPVYTSRRSARLPETEYALIKEWATKTDLVAGGNGLVDFRANVPFPIPATGVEVIWNHITRYRTPLGVKRRYIQAPVQANGAFAPVLFEEEAIFANRFPENPNPNRLFVFLQRILAPARLV